MDTNKIFTEYYSQLNSGVEPVEMIPGVVQEIFENPDLDNRDYHLGAFLNSNITGASVDFIVAAIMAVLEIDNFSSKQIELKPKEKQEIVTIAGSGKKGHKTINISTPASIIAASLGAQVIKPCSRSTSSLTGSSDFLSHLGFKFKDTSSTCEDFYKSDAGFFSIEGLIPKFDYLYGGKALSPTVLSYAFPAIINPIKTNSVLYGLSLPDIRTSIHTLHRLGYNNAIVANSTDDNTRFIDEVGLFTHNNFVFGRIGDGRDEVLVTDPVNAIGAGDRFLIEDISEIKDLDQHVNAGVEVLKGKGITPHTNVICANAGSILLLAGVVEDIREGYLLATQMVLTGQPYDKLIEIINLSGGTYKGK